MTPTTRTLFTAFAPLGLALTVTLATLASLNHLATEQHAATVMAKAAAAQQVRASAPVADLRG